MAARLLLRRGPAIAAGLRRQRAAGLATHAAAAASGACFCRLDARGVVELSGPDAKDLLQGLVTNDVDELSTEGQAMFAGFLNAKGRMVAEVILHRVAEDAFFLDLDQAVIPRITKYLKLTKLRRKVEIVDASDTYRVWAIMGPNQSAELEPLEGDFREIPAGVLTRDPRFAGLGYRLISSTSKDNSGDPVVEALDKLKIQPTSAHTYDRWRTFHGIPEGKEVEDAIPLEFNLDALNGVSFSKGCYTGQELTARTHFQGLVRKRLVPVVLGDGAAPLDADPVQSALFAGLPGLAPSPIDIDKQPLPLDVSTSDADSKRRPGRLVSLAAGSSLGLAHLRLVDGYLDKWTEPGAFHIDSVPLRVPAFPTWWDESSSQASNPADEL